MAPPRKSAKLLALSGTFAKNPKRRRKDVLADGAIGPWVQRSTDPATVWDELVAECPLGVLTAADRVAMEYAVSLVCSMRENPGRFPVSKGTLLISLLGKLGFTPAARLSMSVPDPKDKSDPAEKYFS